MTIIEPISRIPTTPKPAAKPSLWNLIYDEIDDRLQRLNEGKQDAAGGYLNLMVEGGAAIRILTNAEASNSVISISGALTANISIVVPAVIKRLWVIQNSTTGVFTVTIRTAMGTGLAVTQGKRNLVYTDGVEVYSGFTDFASIAMTGTPTAPTAAPGNASPQVATTAFVAAAIDANSGGGLGVDQTWQDFTNTRLVNVVYSNTTGRPIAVSFFIWMTTESTAFYIQCRTSADMPWSTIAGVGLKPTSDDQLSMFGIVPAGYQYRILDAIPGPTNFNWYELR